MRVSISASSLSGSVIAPPSKSMALRFLVCAALARGESVVKGVIPSEDMLAAIDCIRALGADVRHEGDTAYVMGADVFDIKDAVFPCRESGSALRFLVPVAALSSSISTFTGSTSLFARPQDVYEDIFAERGLFFEKKGSALRVGGPLKAGEFRIDGGISSQFVSGLLFVLPLLDADSVIHLCPPVVSGSYTEMTIDALLSFGVRVTRKDDNTILIPGGQRYTPGVHEVEGDWSNAAPFLAMGVEVSGLDSASLQGDKVCTDHFVALDKGMAKIDLSDCPDLGPLLFVYAALRNGGVFTGTKRLRIKESDRVGAMSEELKKCGVFLDVGEDSVTVPAGVCPPKDILYGHNDHRIVMALSVLCAHTGGVIDGAEAVNKSFPGFFDAFKAAFTPKNISFTPSRF